VAAEPCVCARDGEQKGKVEDMIQRIVKLQCV